MTLQTDVRDEWAEATFEGNEREQLRRWSQMSFTEKVRWLEEADRLSRKLAAARTKMVLAPPSKS